ncbi:uncharacterized protein N7483_011258 [Penicillium malachiteum]|uniref:uncharacterized protein n=1 Tax=Penicillium malachiteum TaxID=1324776 RepID=UPI002549967D|nr:uncharacterized protein N7483_011258 [Penicillium malachiteum]KAJ5714077.1 hypothetical protein N7483_011258 [Penicillium malachiteum]
MAIEIPIQKPVITSTKLDLNKEQVSSPDQTLNSLLRHDLVTSDFEELKFQAAASRQLQLQKEGQQYPSSDTDSRLIASPYNESPHLLDLKTLDDQSRLLSLALAYFKPIRNDYATAEYLDSFNWTEVFDLLKTFSENEGHTWTTQTFYVVSFRSRLQPNIDNEYLHALDAYSHQEATASGGLLKYWFGTKNEQRQNLATCIWRNRNDARLGGRGPWHAKARAAGREWYEEIVFSTMKLVIENGVSSWSMSEWTKEDE